MREAVSGLPTKHREVLVLFYLEGMSIAETAEVLRVRPGTVEVRLSRARRKLAAVLGSIYCPQECDWGMNGGET